MQNECEFFAGGSTLTPPRGTTPVRLVSILLFLLSVRSLAQSASWNPQMAAGYLDKREASRNLSWENGFIYYRYTPYAYLLLEGQSPAIRGYSIAPTKTQKMGLWPELVAVVD